MVGDAIDSALQQSLATVEVIVVDDGSTDDTETAVRRYGDRVRYVWTDHGGVAHARNVGARIARGRYLTFLDSDDTLYGYALELEAGLLDRFADIGLVCAEMSGVDHSGLIARYYLKTYHRSAYRDPSLTYDSIFDSSVPLQDAQPLPRVLLQEQADAGERRIYFGNVFDIYLMNLVLCQNTVMYRKSVLDQVGERNVAVKHWQEVDYLLRITRRYRIGFADVPTYRMRFHPGQLSMTGGPTGTDIWMRKQQILLRVVKRHALADPGYYRIHRRRIHRQLAHLHRAAAVPMLLAGGTAQARRRRAACARLHLARCARYGRPAWMLHAASLAPVAIRDVAVRGVESVTQWCRGIASSISNVTPAMSASRVH